MDILRHNPEFWTKGALLFEGLSSLVSPWIVLCFQPWKISQYWCFCGNFLVLDQSTLSDLGNPWREHWGRTKYAVLGPRNRLPVAVFHTKLDQSSHPWPILSVQHFVLDFWFTSYKSSPQQNVGHQSGIQVSKAKITYFPNPTALIFCFNSK